MVTVKNGTGHTITITQAHWKSLEEYQARKTQDPTQIYKEVKQKAEKKEEQPSKEEKS